MMHPLHTKEWLDQLVEQGYSAGLATSRCTGKSTAQALRALAWVIEHPTRELRLQDHYSAGRATDNLLHIAHRMVETLELKHIHFNRAAQTIIFENRERTE